MELGFVLIKSAPNKEHHIYSELIKLKSVGYAQPTHGEYDFVVELRAESFSSLGQIVVDSIQTIPGVLDTRTLTVIKSTDMPSIVRDLETRTEAPAPTAA